MMLIFYVHIIYKLKPLNIFCFLLISNYFFLGSHFWGVLQLSHHHGNQKTLAPYQTQVVTLSVASYTTTLADVSAVTTY